MLLLGWTHRDLPEWWSLDSTQPCIDVACGSNNDLGVYRLWDITNRYLKTQKHALFTDCCFRIKVVELDFACSTAKRVSFVGLRPVIQILCHVLGRGWGCWLRYFTEAKAEIKYRARARKRGPKHDTIFDNDNEKWQWKDIYCQVTQVHLSVHNKVYTNQITNIQHNLLLQCLITWQRGMEALAYVPQ